MQGELATMVGTEVDRMRTLLGSSPDGSYYIPDITLTSVDSDKLRMLTRLLFAFTRAFPEYQWWTTESFGQPGILVNWRRK